MESKDLSSARARVAMDSLAIIMLRPEALRGLISPLVVSWNVALFETSAVVYRTHDGVVVFEESLPRRQPVGNV